MLPVVEFLRELVRFPSLSLEEEAIATYVASYVEDAGLSVNRYQNNIWFSLGSGNRRLLLASHLDVVPPSAGHPYDPFDPVIDDNRIFGRGSVDAKGCGASMTTALLQLHKEGYYPPNGTVIVALTVCEESHPELNGLRQIRPRLPHISAALVGEPTNITPIVAQKGLLVLKAVAHGKSAHAARASLGDNAIFKATRDIQILSDYSFDREDPVLGLPTLAVTTIHGGTANNVVPDTCTFEIDIRSTPAYSHKEIVEDLRVRLESEVNVHSQRIIPVSTTTDEDIVQACLSALPGSKPLGSPTASDWIYLSDVPAVKIGPGSSELSHTAMEHMPITELKDSVIAYKRIIREYFDAGASDGASKS